MSFRGGYSDGRAHAYLDEGASVMRHETGARRALHLGLTDWLYTYNDNVTLFFFLSLDTLQSVRPPDAVPHTTSTATRHAGSDPALRYPARSSPRMRGGLVAKSPGQTAIGEAGADQGRPPNRILARARVQVRRGPDHSRRGSLCVRPRDMQRRCVCCSALCALARWLHGRIDAGFPLSVEHLLMLKRRDMEGGEAGG